MSYEIHKVSDEIVHIIDIDDGGISVTNDAENVVAEVNNRYPNRRIIYRDSMGNWDELVHENGVFKSFKILS